MSRWSGRNFAEDISKSILLNKIGCFFIQISLKFISRGPINNMRSMVQAKDRLRLGDKPVSEQMIPCLSSINPSVSIMHQLLSLAGEMKCVSFSADLSHTLKQILKKWKLFYFIQWAPLQLVWFLLHLFTMKWQRTIVGTTAYKDNSLGLLSI